MPTPDTRGQAPVKMLLAGIPGAGKTGSLAALVIAGYDIVLVDLENGSAPLFNFTPPALHSHIHHVPIMAGYKLATSGRLSVVPRGDMASPPSAFSRLCRFLTDGKLVDQAGAVLKDLGPPESWDPARYILVIDSMTSLGEMIMHKTLALNSHLSSYPDPGDWGTGQQEQDRLMAQLCSPFELPCSLIVTSHLGYVRERTETQLDARGKLVTTSTLSEKLFPSALGSKLPPKIARHFSTVILAQDDITGAPSLHLKSTEEFKVKYPYPVQQNQSILPIATGMATLFRNLHGEPPKQETART